MNEIGLAAQGMQPQSSGLTTTPSNQQQDQQIMLLVQEVMKLLARGVTAQELLQKGVPQEIIDMAIAQMNKQTEVAATPIGDGSGGLASQGMM